MDAQRTALPTVTAAAKPAWRPLADALTGTELRDWFEPQVAESGKSHLYQQVSPDAHLVSGGKASVARMFVDNSTGPLPMTVTASR